VPGLRIVDARRRRGLNCARSAGASAARGDFLAFCDADDVVMPDWLRAPAEAAPHSDLVGGQTDYEALNDGLRQGWLGGPLRPMTKLSTRGYGFLPYVSGGNCGVWTRVARQVGWDESFAFGASDIEFSWRAQLAGVHGTVQPSAVIKQRFRTQVFAVMKQYFRYGAGEPYLFRCFRDRGLPSRGIVETQGTWRWLLRRMPHAMRGPEERGNWLRVAAGRCGRLWGSLRWRVLYT
jgi:glycosyltransferase involved in cell wall biosynthesis